MTEHDQTPTVRRVLDHPRCGPWALAVGVGAGAAAYVEPVLAVVVPVAAYALGRAPSTRALGAVTASLVGLVLLGYAVLTWSDPEVWSAVAVAVVVVGLVPWLVGRHVRERRRLDRMEQHLAETLERRQQELVARTRTRERTRIAREMHDTLGHELSLIALRAGALEVGVGSTSVAQSDAAADLRSAATRATEQLNHVVGLLADDGAAAPLLPQTTGLADLVDRATAAGMEVTLDADDPTLPGVAPVAVQAVQRLVQEGLTNAAKHAPGSRVRVHVATEGDVVEVEVANDRDPTDGVGNTEAPTGGGRGLQALEDRVDYLGGELRAEQGAARFELAARLPRAPHLPAADAPHEPEAVPAELTALRRSARRSLVSAVLAPVAALLVVGACMASWFVYVSIAAVVSPREYAAISVGDSQAAVEEVLPAVEMLEPPTDVLPEPEAPGTSCRYYEGAVSFFDRREVYRICFRDGVVVATDEIAPASTESPESLGSVG